MENRLPFHLKNLCGREIVVWGIGDTANEIINCLRLQKQEVAFYVSRDAQETDTYKGRPIKSKFILDANKHYVIIASLKYFDEIENELIALGKWIAPFDYFNFFKDGLPYGYETRKGRVGKYSRCIPLLNLMEYMPHYVIGSFCQINPTVRVQGNHRMSTICYEQVDNILKPDQFDEISNKYNLKEKEIYFTIGNCVWIGANVFINYHKCQNIGDGAIIGANAVVNADVPPFSVVVGVPGKIIRYQYTEDQIECLLRVKWWDWNDENIRKNAELLYNPQLFFEYFGNNAPKEQQNKIF